MNAEESKHKKLNLLKNEKSPYLIQHMYNPVNWHPWNEEAFSRAKAEDKPIFLSIGYSTCHWCHVMERESFVDENVAKILNENFVCIKVDREERPDIDTVYMNICQSMTGQGGWPLSIFMVPDGKAFYAGTYFPKEDRYGMIGFKNLLNAIVDLWKNERSKLLETSNNIYETLNTSDTQSDVKMSEDFIHEAYKVMLARYDEYNGGFSPIPKFPSPHNIMFLFRYWFAYKEEKALEMAKNTLIKMYKGGIFDHVGFGFSRYSTDGNWLVPHFEKMLYDNALMAICYIEAYQITKDDAFKMISEKVLSFVLREMTSKEGGFYSAQDADSEGEEGKFYIFDKSEVLNILGDRDGEKFCSIYGISEKGNFEGKNILNLIHQKNINFDEFSEECLKKLFSYREKRIHPFLDDKILTSWNGLMIVAFSMASRAFENDDYLRVAKKGIDFIYVHMFDDDGRLYTRYRDGERAFKGYVDDYATLAWALLETFNVTFESKYLEKAERLAHEMIRLFWDRENYGFFQYGSDAEKLITRSKEAYDAAMPSGNSIASLVFYKLYKITGNSIWEDKLNGIFKAFSEMISHISSGYVFLLSSYIGCLSKTKDIVIIDMENSESIKDIIKQMKNKFIPFDQLIYYSKNNLSLNKIIPALSQYQMIHNKPTAYICEDFRCMEPITDLNKIEQILF
jgi:uncharacterized protein YyaL (SSP411 family)